MDLSRKFNMAQNFPTISMPPGSQQRLLQQVEYKSPPRLQAIRVIRVIIFT